MPDFDPGLTVQLSLLLRLVIAAIFAALLGWEREARGRAAGLRTHILVGVASALFVGLDDILIGRYTEFSAVVRADPTRVILAVATGIGFVGGGMIFVSQRERTVHGLTTAASVWATAAIGSAVGLEQYVVAAGAAVLAFVVLRFLPKVEEDVRGANGAVPRGQ